MTQSAPVGPPRRQPLSRALLTAWAAVALIGSAYLLGSHLVALPTPSAVSPRLSAAVVDYAHAGPAARDTVMLHVLYSECRCSQNVATHLLARGAKAGDRELVLLVVDAAQSSDRALTSRLVAAGFETRTIDAETLREAYEIEAAPLLIVADPAGRVGYVGGYGERKQSPVLRDVEIGERIARGEAVAALPLFGCAVSESLRSSLDPLGVLR